MATYYLTFENDIDHVSLGEESYGNFWPEQGFDILMDIVNDEPDALDSLNIIDEHGKHYTIKQFINKIEKLNIKKL